MKKDNYILLINKLDDFIRKYYFNKFIKGVLYTTALIFAFFLIFTLAEYQFYFSTYIRKLMFYSFIFSSIIALFYLVILPLLKIKKLGKTINHQQAAQIVGNHFIEVKDKLLNILQLKYTDVSLEQAALIEASINQKYLELKPIIFSSAIDLSNNKQYLKFVIPPLFIFLLLVFLKPNVLKESSKRLINNNIIYEKPMPFSFIINEDSLSSIQFEDFKLNIKIEGKEIPNNIFLYRKYINDEFTKVFPKKINNTNYSYTFSNLQNNIVFYIEANGFTSKKFHLNVLAKPIITNFEIKLIYPKYLNKKNSILKNTGDISAPFGTNAEWIFKTKATNNLELKFNKENVLLEKAKTNKFFYKKILVDNENYSVKTLNNKIISKDSVQYNILVIKDQYPQISVKEYRDSTNLDMYYYIGNISDDYGLSKLTFNYFITKADKLETEINKQFTKNIKFNNTTNSEFTHFWNIKSINLKPGDKLSYYFEVWDNDGVKGSKSSKSNWMSIKIPTLNEFENKSKTEITEIKKDLIKAIEKSQELQKKMKNFKEKLLNKKDLSWEDKQQMKEMLDAQKKLQKNISNMNEKFKKNIEKQSDFKDINPEIAKKQEQVQKLFDEVLDEEMKKLIEKYEDLLKKLDKEKSIEQAEEMQVTDEELEKELDRMLEMLKKLEFEQKLKETEEKLEKLADKQDKLANNKETQDLKEKQEKINNSFKKIKKDIEELEKIDKELENNTDLEDLEEDAEETLEDLKKALENLSENKMNNAKKSQKEASKKMKEMAHKLSNMAMEMQAESLEEDMESLRQLLENLISLSFKEEYLLSELKITTINTPKYTELVQEQHQLIENTELVEDSLFALAKRVIEIESFITDKIFEINRNLDVTLKNLEERIVRKAVVNQQYVMTGYNDLALMLSEVMAQMQQQMAQQMQGNQSCEKPGKGKPKAGKMPSLKKMQQQLSDQINKMGELIKNGETNKQGNKTGQSKELAKMAAKQQAIREALQKIKEGEKKGSGSLGDLQKIIDEMKQNENDLVNKVLTNDLINRQKEILTRLLEAENAERQRDEKEERKAEQTKKHQNETPPKLKEYLNKRKNSLELYKTIPPNLKPYYRSISEKYFQNSIK